MFDTVDTQYGFALAAKSSALESGTSETQLSETHAAVSVPCRRGAPREGVPDERDYAWQARFEVLEAGLRNQLNRRRY